MFGFTKPLSGPEQKFADAVKRAAEDYKADVESLTAMAGESEAPAKKINWLKLGQIIMAILGALKSENDPD